MTSSKKVLLTGASGLIGKESVKPLQDAGFDIYALTIDKQNPPYKINWIECNMFDRTALKNVFSSIKPQYLLNFAWATTDDYLTSNINFDFLKSGIDLLAYFAENGGKRAVYSGTCFEYKFKDSPLKETDAVNPETVYAKCKNYLREICGLYCEKNNISFGWGRIFYAFGHGENEKRLTAHIIESLKNNKEVVIKNGNLVRDYIYSKDIAGAFVKFLDSNVNGTANICTGKGITLGAYALSVAAKMNKTHLIKILNEPTSQPEQIVGDNTKLTEIIGYKLQYSTDDAINNILK